MDSSFGARLRLQRERQQVALADIAADTKIKVSLLEALERDDLSHWPEGIFRRGYLRSYAHAIGLEPEAVVREFLEVHPDPPDTNPFGEPAQQATGDPVPSGRTTGLKRFLTSAIGAVPVLQQPPRREPVAARVTTVSRAPVAASPLPFEPIATATIDPPQAEGLPLELVDAQIEPAVAAGSRDRETSLRREPDISAAADLCTRLGRVADGREMGRVLEDAARLLDAVGLIAWYWDSCAQALRPWLAQGYSEAVLAQTQAIRRDAANAIADAYRSAETCVVNGDDEVTGAVAVPLMAPTGCVGVLALELRHGGEQLPSVRALATILAAQLVTLLGSDPLPEAVSA